jgi:glycerophosphoryl diester phosphodiesterase
MPRPGHPYLAGAPQLVAHRGGSRIAPENTLVAFRRALAWWDADLLELDVRLSRDGVVVVIHDETVDRTTDGTGRIQDLPYAALAELDAGHRFVAPDGGTPFRGVGVRIPRFEELLEEFPDARLNVECKSADVAAPLKRMVERHGAAHRVLVAAQWEKNREGARGYRGPWGATREQVTRFRFLPLGYTPEADVLQVPERFKGIPIVTRGFVARAHRRNLPVQVWVVDDPDDMRRLLALGVDGLQSDRPDLLARVLTEVARRPPPPGAPLDPPWQPDPTPSASAPQARRA